MAEFDLVIKNGMVVDGRRMPRYRADVGIKEGKIAEIGQLRASDGSRVLDATGLIVAPGFVDLHTHYDAQIFWDPYCTISGWHGVTSVVIGNCGIGFAPVRPEMREQAMRSMSRQEAIPLEVMQAGMPWDWVTFPEFLDSLDRTPKSVNVQACVPLGPLVTWVMGRERAKAGEMPADGELAEMCGILDEAISAGAAGWSLLRGLANHRDYDGTPLVTDVMPERILMELARALGKRNEGMIKMTFLDEQDPRGTFSAWEALAEASGRPMIYDSIGASSDEPERHRVTLEWLESCRRRGLQVYGQAFTTDNGVTFKLADEFNLLGGSPAWRHATVGTPEEVRGRLEDPTLREALRREKPDIAFSFDRMTILKGHSPAVQRYENLTVAEVAQREGKHPADAFCDLVLADSLETLFYSTIMTNQDGLREIVQYPWSIFGISDGGAHQKFFTAGRYATEALIRFVREKEWIDLEEAHWRLSALPAACAGFLKRGTLQEGAPADIVVYDFENLTITPDEIVHDLPCGDWRRVQRGKGYRYVLVNGEITIEEDKETGASSGVLLRHGL